MEFQCKGMEVPINNKMIHTLRFTDDWVKQLKARSIWNLRQEKYGRNKRDINTTLSINMDKTKYLRTGEETSNKQLHRKQ